MAVWPNFRSMCPEELFENNIVLQKRTFFFFKHWTKHVRKMGIFCCVLWIPYYVTRGAFPESFLEVLIAFFIYFGPLEKKFRSVCQNCFLWTLKIVLKVKGFFFEKFLFLVFRNWIKHFLDFWQEHFGRVAELTLEEPRGTIWERCFFWSKFFFFRLWDKNVRKRAKIFGCDL